MPAIRIKPVMVYLSDREREELERRAADNARSLSAELRYAARLAPAVASIQQREGVN